MSRTDAIVYLGDEFSEYLSAANISPDEDGLGSAVDRALLLLGTADSDLATATIADGEAYRAVLDYTTLLKIRRRLGPTYYDQSRSLSTPGVSLAYKKSQVLADVKDMLADAVTRAGEFITIGDTNSWQAPGRAALDTYNRPYLGDLGVDPGLGPIG